MSRQITKELAIKIKQKLCNVDLTKPRSAHEVWGIEHSGRLVGIVSIRRGSEKDKGHDYIPKDINVSPNFAKEVGICNKNLQDYIACLREKGLLPLEEDDTQSKQED